MFLIGANSVFKTMNEMKAKFLNNIDIQRLAGIKSIIGIDLTEQRARVVELEKNGSIFNRFHTKFRARQSFSCQFPPDMSPSAKSGLLKHLLAEHHIVTTFAVSTVQSIGVKTVQATIPPGTLNIEEWIYENRERLLRLPTSAEQFVHTYEITDDNASGSLVEITFVRKSDTEAMTSFITGAGLSLLSLAAGPRDAFNAFLLGEEGATSEDLKCVHVSTSLISTTTVSNGKRGAITHSRRSDGDGLESVLRQLPDLASTTTQAPIFAGEIPAEWPNEHRVLKPFGLSTEHTLAAGLAVKGFFPELSPTNLLSWISRQHAESLLFRSLMHRVVLACGSILMALLLLQIVASFYLQSRIDRVDERLLALGPAYTDVVMLENQVKALENQLEGRDVSFKRSRMAQTLHRVAGLAPDGLWLYRLHQDHPNGQPKVLALYGYARSNELVADFVKSLTSGVAEAMLIRAGTPLRSESLVPGGQESSQFITFQINLKMPD